MIQSQQDGFVLQVSRGVTLEVPHARQNTRFARQIEVRGQGRIPTGTLVATCHGRSLDVKAHIKDGGTSIELDLVRGGKPVHESSTFRDLYNKVAEGVEAYLGDNFAD